MKTLNFPHGLSGKGGCSREGSAITSHTSAAFPHLLQRAREASGQSQPDLALSKASDRIHSHALTTGFRGRVS